MKSRHILSAFLMLLLAQTTSAQLIHINSPDHFKSSIENGKPTVLEFFATWCGVCTRAKPMVEQLAQKFSDVNFLIVDGDLCPSLKNQYNIQAFPTFIFLDNKGKEVDRILGMETLPTMEKTINKIRQSAKMMDDIRKTDDVKPVKEKSTEVVVKEELKKPETKPTPIKEHAIKTLKLEKNLIELDADDQFEKVLARGPVVLDFYTTWCGPCKVMKPIIEKLAQEYTDVIFLTIDAERFKNLERKYEIKAYPTFIFLDASGKEVDRFRGGSTSDMPLRGKLGKISSKKSNVMIMDEQQMMEKMKAEGQPMPQQATTKEVTVKQMPKEKPVDDKKIKKEEKKRYKRGQKYRD